MPEGDFDWLADRFGLSPEGVAELELDQFRADDWESETDWQRMLWAAARTDPVGRWRPLWLFAAACVRQGWGLQPPARRRAIILGEAVADRGVAVTPVLVEAVRSAASSELPSDIDYLHMRPDQAQLVMGTFCCNPIERPSDSFERIFALTECESGIDRGPCAGYLRDLIYNSFLPQPAFDEAWLYANGAAVLLLAQDILYDYRYDRLPELADALEKAGCADDRILGHCRSPGPHVRGCWAVDGLLRPDRDPLQRLLRHAPVPGDRLAAYLLAEPRDVFALYCG